MFNGCKSLISLNLSNFVTSKMENMENMFNGCESLKIIDFSNLDVNSVVAPNKLKNAFLNCKELEYINIKNLQARNKLTTNFFNGVPKNLILCIQDDKINLNKDTIDDNNNFMLINCNNNLSYNEYKLNTENGCFIKNCSFINYKYEFQHKCYNECPVNSKQRKNNKELAGILLDEIHLCEPICNETFPFEKLSSQECVQNCNTTSILNKLCALNYQEKGNT